MIGSKNGEFVPSLPRVHAEECTEFSLCTSVRAGTCLTVFFRFAHTLGLSWTTFIMFWRHYFQALLLWLKKKKICFWERRLQPANSSTAIQHELYFQQFHCGFCANHGLIGTQWYRICIYSKHENLYFNASRHVIILKTCNQEISEERKCLLSSLAVLCSKVNHRRHSLWCRHLDYFPRW